MLVWIGLGLVLLGILLVGLGLVAGALGLKGGRVLPGDIVISRPGFTFYFPIVTSLALSIFLTLVLWMIAMLRR